MNKKWLALWKGPYNGSFRRTVDILVEVRENLRRSHII